MKSSLVSLFVVGLLSSAAALAQGPVPALEPVGQLPALGQGTPFTPYQPPSLGLPFPQTPPTETTAAVKALAHVASDLEKFVGLNPKAEIGEATVAFQADGGYLVTITSRVCEPSSVPMPLPLPVSNELPALPPAPEGLTSIVPTSNMALGMACPTYAMLQIKATPDTDKQDGYDFEAQVWTLKKARK